MIRRLLVAILLTSSACARQHAPAPTQDTDAAAAGTLAAAAVEPPRPRELQGVPWMMDLVEEGLDASDARADLGVVSVPLGATEPRPVMVALHGWSDRPQWACGAWRGVNDAYPVLVCPRGAGPVRALGWQSPEDTRRRIDRAIAAARKLLPGWVRDDEVIVLAGFSMGAVQAALLAQREPKRFRRVVLAESAYDPESSMRFGAPWARGGGERLVLLCTTSGCEAPYRASARNVAGHHVPARVNFARVNEHNLNGLAVRSMRRDWPWLVEGAPGWETYRQVPDDAGVQGKSETFDAR